MGEGVLVGIGVGVLVGCGVAVGSGLGAAVGWGVAVGSLVGVEIGLGDALGVGLGDWPGVGLALGVGTLTGGDPPPGAAGASPPPPQAAVAATAHTSTLSRSALAYMENFMDNSLFYLDLLIKRRVWCAVTNLKSETDTAVSMRLFKQKWLEKCMDIA